MNLHEYQGKAILKTYGVNVPVGYVGQKKMTSGRTSDSRVARWKICLCTVHGYKYKVVCIPCRPEIMGHR